MTNLHVDIFNRVGDFLGVLGDEPVEIQEYEEYPLEFKLQSEIDSASVTLEIEGQQLPRQANVFSYGSSKTMRGRRGELMVCVYHERRQIATYYLHLTGILLSEAQYHYLVRDLHGLVSLISADDTGVRGTDVIWKFLTLYDKRFTAIGTVLDTLKLRLAEIERQPQRRVSKHYHLEREAKARRIDARTIRWQTVRGAQNDGRVLTYDNVLHTDVYENQFVVYLLTQLQHYLSTAVVRFEHTVDQKIEDVEKRIDHWNTYQEIEGDGANIRLLFKQQQLKKLRELHNKLVEKKRLKLPQYTSQAQGYQQQITGLQRTTFLADVHVPTTFVLKPTLILTKDPAYNAVYQCYQELDRVLRLEEHERLATLLDRVPIERTSKLYEYWVFLQVYVELKRMGFQDAPTSRGLWSIIDQKSFRLRSDSCLHLVGDPDLYTYRSKEGLSKTIEVYLRYEHRIGLNRNLCPDVFIEFILRTKKILIIDAKYRDYQSQGYAVYKHDLEDVADRKYLQLMQQVGKDGPWVKVSDPDDLHKHIAASFIIHSHVGDDRYVDYGSLGKCNKYGALPLVPTEQHFNPTNLKRLLKMFMRMQLHLFDICWSDAHERPHKAKKVRELGGKYRVWWECEYHCVDCDNRWWVNHCGRWCQGKDRHVAKITFADPSDNFFEFDDASRGTKRLLRCSSCNQSYHHGL